jgi:mannose-6-phosphate isomerase
MSTTDSTNSMLSNLYPLKFEPIYISKTWGGRNLENFGRILPGDSSHAIGESWELADLDRTSVSGAGGQAAQSVASNGRLAGMTIQQLIQLHPDDLLGETQLIDGRVFPFLIKILDACENLSLQVHPSPEYVMQHPEADIKTECWFIIDAQPGAVIYKGMKPGVDEDQLRGALVTGDVLELLNCIHVKAGDFYYLPSGTCHALGAGILVAEVQTPSDTTFRLYDWGRTDRALHIEEALACIQYHDHDTTSISLGHDGDQFQCENFTVRRIRGALGQTELLSTDQLAIWIVCSGSGKFISKEIKNSPIEFKGGETLLLPAVMPYRFAQFDRETSIIQITDTKTQNFKPTFPR